VQNKVAKTKARERIFFISVILKRIEDLVDH
jgi:hypothetical protein